MRHSIGGLLDLSYFKVLFVALQRIGHLHATLYGLLQCDRVSAARYSLPVPIGPQLQ